MIEIKKPRIECIETPADPAYGKYVVEPLERGYGTTLGKSLRRVLLSSLPGTAFTSVKIAGIQHEYSTIPGVVEDGSLNRKKLGAIVFSDENALSDLNKITHSAIRAEVIRRLADTPRLAAIDAIALFESGLAELCDVTVAVTAPVEDRVKRLMIRDNIPEDYARARIAAQHDENWFREKCGYVLSNDADYQSFQSKCLAFLDTIGII